MTLTEHVKFDRVAPNSGAASTYTLSGATTAVNSAAVLTTGFSGAAFSIHLGAIASTGTITFALEGSADGTNNWTAITGATYTATADSDDNKLVILAADHLAYPYVRVATVRGTATSALDSMAVMLFNPGLTPVTQGTLVEAAVAVG